MQKRKLFNITFDTKEYLTKPPKDSPEYSHINNRIVKAEAERLSIENIAYKIGRGSAYVSGEIRDGSRTKENIDNIDFISLDIDNDNGTKWTPGEVIEEVYKLIGTRPFMYYQTFTGETDTGAEKFRLLYSLEDTLSHIEVTPLLEYLADNLSNILDTNCKDTSRLYQGTNASNRKIETYSDYTEIPTNLINQIVSHKEAKELEAKAQREADRIARAEKRAKDLKENGITYNDDVIDELTQIDLSDYLLDMGYSDIKKTHTGYKMPCPIHNGTNDNFNINYVNGQWLYICFSKCGGRGGNIISLHKELTGLSSGEAIKELCEKYNIQRYESVYKLDNKTDTYTIDKYISNNIEVSQSIIEAIKENNTTLISGSMGIGKTHFILNDLKEYAQTIDKKVIVVIPSRKQLDYLCETKHIDIVCQDHEYKPESDLIATTPESLNKLFSNIKEDEYILVVDECHEKITSLYRKAYEDRKPDIASSTAYRTLYLTATPRLLKYDTNIDKVVNIKVREKLSNNLSIIKYDEDRRLSIRKIVFDFLKQDRQVVLFNDDKKENKEDFENGISKMIPGKSIERLQSGILSENIAKGTLEADLTITTSSINAGIDLEYKDKPVLIVDMRTISIDSLIQLIGRFRKGVEVYLLMNSGSDEDTNIKPLFDLDTAINTSIGIDSNQIKYLNDNKIKTLYDGISGIQNKSHAKLIDDKWELDLYSLINEVYEIWNNTLRHRPDELINLLKEQEAFDLIGDIKILQYHKPEDDIVSKARRLEAREKKAEIERISQNMLKIHTDDITSILIEKDIEALNHIIDTRFKPYNVTKEDIITYKELAQKDIKKIKDISKKLFIDKFDQTGKTYHSGYGFKVFYSESKRELNRILDTIDTIKVNESINTNGLDIYLSDELKNIRHSKDILVAKIRKELKDIENKKGRISDKRLASLTNILSEDGYFKGKLVNIYNNEEATPEDRQRAFNKLKEKVMYRIECIYNLRGGNLISSIRSYKDEEDIISHLVDKYRTNYYKVG